MHTTAARLYQGSSGTTRSGSDCSHRRRVAPEIVNDAGPSYDGLERSLPAARELSLRSETLACGAGILASLEGSLAPLGDSGLRRWYSRFARGGAKHPSGPRGKLAECIHAVRPPASLIRVPHRQLCRPRRVRKHQQAQRTHLRLIPRLTPLRPRHHRRSPRKPGRLVPPRLQRPIHKIGIIRMIRDRTWRGPGLIVFERHGRRDVEREWRRRRLTERGGRGSDDRFATGDGRVA